ncbi:hypothetical protein L0668_10700 [Paraglaciecola aquimarina]|uniref:DUF8198 domain-containing protein n=1 Tax=Paraglaciecola algarum TaxID=3050085 RepID=A0ABS9D9A7_9ALTE|nr:hypothetical protein [Paraglaciecola sp. G1-23]MCF2948577.1 hypothetical protein [Paraglaciecola sp. G1-23]
MESLQKQIFRHMHGIQTMQEIAEKSALMDLISDLHSFQKLRFLDTQQALYRNKNTNKTVMFWANQLYSLLSFTSSKLDPIEVMQKSLRFIPYEGQQVLVSLLHLKAICFELDFDLAQRLKHSELDAPSYQQAYATTNNYALRQKQIAAINALHQDMHYLTRIRGINFLLFLFKKPAVKLGMGELLRTIKIGYDAYLQLDNPDEFSQSLIFNETQVVHRYFQTSIPETPKV